MIVRKDRLPYAQLIFLLMQQSHVSILKHKSSTTLTKLHVPIFTHTFHSVIMRLTSHVICLAFNIKIRTLWLMVAKLKKKF